MRKAHTVLRRQAGLTLVELLVAMAVSLLVAIAALSSLIVSRQGFSSVDAASQLRDSARFATDRIQRVGVQAGFKDIRFAATARPGNAMGVSANPEPGIRGFNNMLASATNPLAEGTVRTAGTPGYGSDILIIRVQTPETFPGSGVADASMIDCAGTPGTSVMTDRDAATSNVFHVDVYRGEPTLMCTTVSATGTIGTPRPVVKGVENFQVLYGVDSVTPNAAPSGVPDSIPDSYLRADQMTVIGDAVATNANWRRVRSLRIGMVLRGPERSAIDLDARRLFPLGVAASSAGGGPGTSLSSTSDPGTLYDPPADGRLRQVVTFTVHLRNEQGL